MYRKITFLLLHSSLFDYVLCILKNGLSETPYYNAILSLNDDSYSTALNGNVNSTIWMLEHATPTLSLWWLRIVFSSNPQTMSHTLWQNDQKSSAYLDFARYIKIGKGRIEFPTILLEVQITISINISIFCVGLWSGSPSICTYSFLHYTDLGWIHLPP